MTKQQSCTAEVWSKFCFKKTHILIHLCEHKINLPVLLNNSMKAVTESANIQSRILDFSE